MFNAYNFLTTVHFRVNKLLSVTPFILKVTCYKVLVWIWNCFWTHSNITKVMWRAKVRFSKVLMLLVCYFICITHYFSILFNIVKDYFICISTFQKIFININLIWHFNILRLEEVKQFEEPSSVTPGTMLGHETSFF